MPQINGLVSGLDINSILNSLATSLREPATALQSRQALITKKQSAWNSIDAQVGKLQSAAKILQDLFKSSSPLSVAVSDPSILSAKSTDQASVGTHVISVQRLAQSQKSLAQGVESNDQRIMGTGSITIHTGVGADDHDVTGATALSFLNNGVGVSLGSIKITDRFGASASIDLSQAETVQDVLDTISAASGVRVTASLNQDGTGIKIVDDTNSTNGALKIEEDGGTTAASLNIATGSSGVSSATFEGGDLDPLYKVTLSDSNNTLNTLRIALNNLGGPFSASLLNDGTTSNANHLVLNSSQTGSIGALAISVQTDAISQELVGNGNGAKGATLGDYQLHVGGLSDASDVSLLTVGAQNYTVRNVGQNTGVGFEVEVEKKTGKLQFFEDGVASNVSGEIRADYQPPALSFAEIQTAEDSWVKVGSSNTIDVYSHNNTLTSAIGGINLTLIDADPAKQVQVKVQNDISSINKAVQDIITAYNSTLDMINGQNTYNPETKAKGGPLFGDSQLFSLESQISNLLVNDVPGLDSNANSIFQLGVGAGEGGKLTLDTTRLNDWLTNRFDDTKAILTKTLNAAPSAIVTAQSTAVGYDKQTLVDGVTSSDNFGPGGQGWMDNTPNIYPDTIALQFSSTLTLTQALISTVNSAGMPTHEWGVKDYDLQYLRIGGNPSTENDWLTLASVRDNTQGTNIHSFNVQTDQMRVKVLGSNAADGQSRLVEFQVTQASGVASRMVSTLNALRDPANGIVTNANKNLQEEYDRLGSQITNIDTRADAAVARFQKQYSDMEQALANMQAQGNMLTSQLSILSRG